MTTQTDRSSQRRSRPRFYSRRKFCQPCVDKKRDFDYKDVEYLKKYLSDRFMIEARRKTGMCAKCQRTFAKAVKRARQLSLIPYSPAHRGAMPINYRR
ncbi:MAG: 30S ribosomal protein S18 [Dehalococcoidia bacterium]|nr:30S ribosomal protein S18 [Chloroflexota bacterium]MBI51340.1 30S ribosomal protein S18 [Chloroflexota bacterium]MBR96893.1 30S ribosomal protein S18 [Dehalococcoidia bacterium]